MAQRSDRHPLRRAFPTLLALSALAILLPPSWTGCLRVVVQPVEWVRGGASRLTQQARHAAERSARPQPSREELERALLANEQLQRQIAHQSARLDQLAATLDDLTGIRAQLLDSSRIVIARVLAFDSDARRRSLRIAAGSFHGVQRGAWVAAGMPRDPAAHADGRTLLYRQCLVGVVSEVFTHSSQVTLLTDSAFGPRRARFAKRLPDATLQLADEECLIRGHNGRALVEQAPAQLFQRDFRYLLVPPDAAGPGMLLIGHAVSATPLETTPLVANLTVEPLVDFSRLTHVYVIVAAP